MEVVVEEKQLREIDKEIRKEKIFGKIYMMASPSKEHQIVVGNLYFNLRAKKENNCEIMIAPFDVVLECRGENIVQPDVMVFCDDKLCAVFEVLSPSTALKDKKIKSKLYECAGIKEYFIVEREYKIIEKFELINGKYEFIGNFAIEDKMEIKCIDSEIEVKNIFEGVE